MPNGDPIYYHVHKILEALDLDREVYPDDKTISELEHILIHLLTECPHCSEYRDRIRDLELHFEDRIRDLELHFEDRIRDLELHFETGRDSR